MGPSGRRKIDASTLKTNLRNAQKRKTIARAEPTMLPLTLSATAESQPKTTLQKPKPLSAAERNLSTWMYLPRRIPSTSATAVTVAGLLPGKVA